jgi:GNAT superfamily N-acetyltransferase
MREVPAAIELRLARVDEGLRVDAMIRAELVRYREWAPDWELGPAPPDLVERLATNFADPERAWILVAESGGEIVGVVPLALSTAINPDAPPPGTVNLWQMFVRRDLQGSGLAGALHDRAVAQALERGYDRMVLWTPAGAAQARRFYEREGWTLCGESGPETDFGLPLVQYELLIGG